MMQVNWKIAGYCAGLIILLLLVTKIDPSLLTLIFTTMKPLWLIPIVFLRVFVIVMSAVNIKVLLDASSRVKMSELIRYQLLRFSGSTIIPLSGATIPFVYLLKKRNKVEVSTTMAVLSLDKVVSVSISLSIIFAALVRYTDMPSLPIMIAVILLFVGAFYLLFYAKMTKWIIQKCMPKRFAEQTLATMKHLRWLCRDHKSAIAMNVAVTLLTFLINGLVVLFAFNVLNYPVGLIDSFIITNIAQVAALFPVTPDGLGVRQAIGVFLFSGIGVPTTITLAMYAVLVIIKYALGALFVMSTRLRSSNPHDA